VVRLFPASVVLVGGLLMTAAVLFMVLPLMVVVASSLTAGNFLTFPPQGLSLRWYQQALSTDAYLRAGWTSLWMASLVTASAVVVGGAAAIAVHRMKGPAHAGMSALLLSPLVLPTIIFGIGLLLVFSRHFGGPSLTGLWLGHTVLAVPYVVRTTLAVLSNSDPMLEEAARTMGAGPWRRLWTITLPQCRVGLLAGGFFAFNISFDEAVIALFLRSPGVDTLPLRIYGELEYSSSPGIAAVSAMMIALTVLLIVIVERIIGIGRVT
jgi:putative spermidine/putrescine transport system permease protein